MKGFFGTLFGSLKNVFGGKKKPKKPEPEKPKPSAEKPIGTCRLLKSDINNYVYEVRRQYGQSYVDLVSDSLAVKRVRGRICTFAQKWYSNTAKAEFMIMSMINTTTYNQIKKKSIEDKDIERILRRFVTTKIVPTTNLTVHAFIKKDMTAATFASDVVDFQEVNDKDITDIEEFLDGLAVIFLKG